MKKILTFFHIIIYTLNDISSKSFFEETDQKIFSRKRKRNEKTGSTRR